MPKRVRSIMEKKQPWGSPEFVDEELEKTLIRIKYINYRWNKRITADCPFILSEEQFKYLTDNIDVNCEDLANLQNAAP